MSIPSERTRAVMNTREFLLDLLDSRKTPKVPSHVRNAARHLLKHYPGYVEMYNAAKECPQYFGKPDKKET